jgi:hypothetical protein
MGGGADGGAGPGPQPLGQLVGGDEARRATKALG